MSTNSSNTEYLSGLFQTMFAELFKRAQESGEQLKNIANLVGLSRPTVAQSIETLKAFAKAKSENAQAQAAAANALLMEQATLVVSEASDEIMYTNRQAANTMRRLIASLGGYPEMVNEEFTGSIDFEFAIGLDENGDELTARGRWRNDVEGPDPFQGYLNIYSGSTLLGQPWYHGRGVNLEMKFNGVTFEMLLDKLTVAQSAWTDLTNLATLMATYGGSIDAQVLMMKAMEFVSPEIRSLVQNLTNRTRSLSAAGFISVVSKYLETICPHPDLNGRVSGASPTVMFSSLANIGGVIIAVVATVAATVLNYFFTGLGIVVSALFQIFSTVTQRIKAETSFTKPTIEGYPFVYTIRDVLCDQVQIPRSAIDPAIRATLDERGCATVATPYWVVFLYDDDPEGLTVTGQWHPRVIPVQNLGGGVWLTSATADANASRVSKMVMDMRWDYKDFVDSAKSNWQISDFSNPTMAENYDVVAAYTYALLRLTQPMLLSALRPLWDKLVWPRVSSITCEFDSRNIYGIPNQGWSYWLAELADVSTEYTSDKFAFGETALQYLNEANTWGNRWTITTASGQYDVDVLDGLYTRDQKLAILYLSVASQYLGMLDRDYSNYPEHLGSWLSQIDAVHLQSIFIAYKKVVEVLGQEAFDLITPAVLDVKSSYPTDVPNLKFNSYPGYPTYNPDDFSPQFDIPNLNLATVKQAITASAITLGVVTAASVITGIMVTRYQRAQTCRLDATLELSKAKLARGEIDGAQYRADLQQNNKGRRKLNKIVNLFNSAPSAAQKEASSQGNFDVNNVIDPLKGAMLTPDDPLGGALAEMGIELPDETNAAATSAVPHTLDDLYLLIVGAPVEAPVEPPATFARRMAIEPIPDDFRPVAAKPFQPVDPRSTWLAHEPVSISVT